MAIRLVIFDLGGTTVESRDYMHGALKKGFKKAGYSITRDDTNGTIEIPDRMVIETLLKDRFKVEDDLETLAAKVYEGLINEIVLFYKTHPSVKAKKNVVKTFKLLKQKGMRVALDSGFPREIADTLINRLGWKKKNLVDYCVTSDDVERCKPHPDMIYKAMKDLKILSTGHVAKVGESRSDLKQGMSAGCRYVIGIPSGPHTREELMEERYTHLIDNLLTVVDIVNKKK